MRSLAPRQHEQHELCDLKETRVLRECVGYWHFFSNPPKKPVFFSVH